MSQETLKVPIGPATVEYGSTIFDITKGGVEFEVTTNTKDITVDQYGDAPIDTVLKGRICNVMVPFALHDLAKLADAIPNSKYTTDGTKSKLEVYGDAGFRLLKTAKPLIIKPTDPDATADDWITVPLAAALGDPKYTFNSDNERVAQLRFVGYPDTTNKGLLYVLGDETVVEGGAG
ncbi:hypothetical protein FZC76_21615 [Sutcliffiella horikoshii]|uniref:Uncharacterized protein n=1 Tax=Sutcliffiella horikoshii TaxID=79883 RepID=A0A5D4SA32_9BACI|nr:hypothetical protein [Sutcliffiella horikoshii]TYS60473.1 hypothetical protein FZC76_21615 [Sutcliffiella horikoshii]